MTGTRRKAVEGLGGWVGRWVEARMLGGGCYRGRLRGVAEGMLVVERHDGHDVLLPTERLLALCDEDRAVAAARGEREGGEV